MIIKKDRNILSLSNGAYKHYTETVRGNKDDDYYLAMCKLTRNYILGTEVTRYADNDCIRRYGNMLIRVRGTRIVWINNSFGGDRYINEVEKEALNEVYRLNKEVK